MLQPRTDDSIHIEPGEPGRLIVRFPYSREGVDRIKTVPGRRWHPVEKYWSIPDTETARAELESLFAGEPMIFPPEPAPRPAPPKELLDRIHHAARARHLSPRTEEAYVGWARRFIRRTGPETAQLGEAEIGRFLSSLAQDAHVSASTQNQALHALLFLYQEVLGKEIRRIEGVVRAKEPVRIPVVLSREEVRAVLELMSGPTRLMAMLLYGAGLRLLECCQLRVKDIDFSQNQVVVRAGKGNKDRRTALPTMIRDPLTRHLEAVRRMHQEDLRIGLGSVALPGALDRKYPNAPK
ncbi:MAG: phage integrase N-terminal SAM-like domain-containing protein, partial [Elusimicrobiota bacterium]